MKKIVLLILSGLLIASIAGSALATPASSVLINKDTGDTISDKDLNLQQNVPLNIQFKVTAYTPAESDHTYTYGYAVTVLQNKNGNMIGSKSDINVVPPTPATFYLPTITSGTGTFLDSKFTTVTLLNSVKDAQGAPAIYKITIGDEGFILTSASTNVSVPEFPTVALPVAAVLGLLFVFGRKKVDV
jgi:hypothetical protein